MPPINLGLGLGLSRLGIGGNSMSPLLDQIGTAAGAAFGLRLLRNGYAGSAVRVRRSSDNLEADIGFNADGSLNTTALLAHCGAGSGFVTTWYDQSTNGRNLVQTTAANQPRIVNAGAVETVNGKPSILFDSTDRFTSANGTSFMVAAGSATVFVVANDTGTAATWIVGEAQVTLGNSVYVPLAKWNAANDVYSFIRNSVNVNQVSELSGRGPDGWTTALTQFIVRDSGSELLRGVNGTTFAQAYTRSGSYTVERLLLENNTGYISEVVLYGTALSSANINTIASSQAGEYGISVIPFP